MNDILFRICGLLFMAYISVTTLYASEENITLENNVGLKMVIPKTSEGYSFGTIFINDKQVEKSLLNGIILFKDTKTNNDIWYFASEAEKISGSKCKFLGNGLIQNSLVSFEVTIETPQNISALKITYDFSVDQDIDNIQACLLFHKDFEYNWKCHMYPWAEDSKFIQRDPLNWMGIPSLFQYRNDLSLGLLWGIDPNSDYLNPTTWTKDFGLYFIDGQIPSQYRVGGKGLKKSVKYLCPMQIVITDHNDPDEMITDLMKNWINLNNYKVDHLEVRTNDEALEKFLFGRKNTSMWYPGKGYRLEMGDPSSAFIYIGEQGLSALFEYKIYELTGNSLWRQRAFEQMDFISKGQNLNLEDPNYGYIHTAYSLVDYGPAGKGFNSYDRGSNIGYKIDINIYLGRYILHIWQRVKTHEGVDRRDWYNMAILAIDWALRQQNSDGGLPQKLDMIPIEKLEGNEWMGTGHPQHVKFIEPGEKSISATSGRALPALWHIYRITRDPKYKRVMLEVENYNLVSFQNKFLFNSHHPDLPPHTLEEAGIWGICEYWLNRYDETMDKNYLKHAVANAYLSLTWKCPKQLSWVKNPTQLGSAEQQYFLQYSIYCYQNRQVECLEILFKHTGNKLFHQLAERITQNVYWTQVADGDLVGATHERICDPWLARDDGGDADFNSMGTVYMSEQSLDLLLQIVEMYRIGKYICNDINVENKSYPSGEIYYSKDIKNKTMTTLGVVPSAGSVVSKVRTWNPEKMAWILSKSSEPEVQIIHKIDSLIPKNIYTVFIDGKESVSIEADSKGRVEFQFKIPLDKDVLIELAKAI